MTKKTIGILITALLIGTMIVLTVKSNIEETKPIDNLVSTNNQVTGFKTGETPPDFELATLSGELIKLSDYKGKKVILNFWASWCGPCKAEMPHMENYYKKNKESDNVEILAVNLTDVERKGLEGVENFIDAYGLTFPIPLDKDGRIMDEYRVIGIPTTYFINTDGTIAQVVVSAIDEKSLKSLVNKMN